MSYLTVYEPPMFEENIHETKEEDLITAELENDIKGKLLNNDVYLKQGLQKHTNTNDIHVTAEEKKAWNEKADNTEATTVNAGLLSATDKKKLDTVKENAEENQLAISNVKVGDTIVQADSKTSQLKIVAGSNITLTGDNATKKVEISAKNTVYKHPDTGINTTLAYHTVGVNAQGHVVSGIPTSDRFDCSSVQAQGIIDSYGGFKHSGTTGQLAYIGQNSPPNGNLLWGW